MRTVLSLTNRDNGQVEGFLYIITNVTFFIIASTVFYSTISFILEKNGSAIIACMFIPTIINLVLGFLDSRLKKNISEFWLDNISRNFLGNPTLSNLTSSVTLYIVYIVIIAFVGTQILKKKEIK